MVKEHKYPALRYRDFRLIWGGQLVSNSGTQMQIVAINWHIYLLTGSPIGLGIVGLARFIPIVIFALIGGSIVDAHNRKKILLLAQVILGTFSAILAFLTFTNTITPNLVYVLTALTAAAMSLDSPARQALVPNLVDRKHLSNAMSLNVIMFQLGTVIGPALSGFIIAGFGVGAVYLINTITFICMIIAILNVKNDGAIKGTKTPVSISSMLEGLKFVRSRTMIWSTMLVDFFATFFASATVLLPIFAQDILKVGPQGLGFLYAAPSIGAVIAGFVVAHAGVLKRQGKILLWSVAIFGIATIVFGISKNFWLSLVCLAVLGAGDSVSAIIRNTIRQHETPDHLRGRMVSVNMIFFMGGPQIGEFEAGLLAAAVGGPISVVVGGVATILMVGVTYFAVPKLRNYDSHDETVVLPKKL